ncbi:PAS domain-containing protein, partial [Mycobacterium tuberculosis]|nr:PAS domain-containing protein [Mycobacterium tuberculosis]
NVIDCHGRTKWLLTSKLPLRDAGGTVIGVVGVCRDITERRHSDLFAAGQAAVLEKIVKNRPLPEVLTRIIDLIGEQI